MNLKKQKTTHRKGTFVFSLSLRVLTTPFDIVNIVKYREYRPIKCCTKITPTFNAVLLDKLEFVSITTALSHWQS